MRNFTTALLLGSVLVAGAIAAPTLYARDQKPSGGNEDGNDGGGMMSMMMGMMSGMRHMGHCGGVMSDGRPNERWRRNSPSPSDSKG
jgi:hypothetical protein